MARIRSIKPEAFTSESLAKVSVDAERTFFGMSTIADDRGRLPDKPAQINGDLWSMRGGHTAADLESELGQLVVADELVCRYIGCNGKRYLHLVTWDWHQKIDHPSKTRLPRCPHHLVSVTGKAEDCGLHDGPCPTSRESVARLREDSRGARPSDGDLASTGGAAEGAPTASQYGTLGTTSSDQRKPETSRDSRESSRDIETDLGPRTVDLGSIPPTAGAVKPRRAAKTPAPSEAHIGTVVAAYVDGATGAGQPAPASSLRARVGKQARQLLADGYSIEALMAAAQHMGAGEWNDLAVQVRKDAAAANGSRESRAQPTMRGGARQKLLSHEEAANLDPRSIV